jgi:acetoin utilization deacetylase AcuC-like enzyme
MTLIYRDPRFLDHATGSHPEKPSRLVAIDRRLQETGLDRRATRPQSMPISIERLARVHDAGYIEQVRQFVARGGGLIEADTVVSPQSFDVALLAAGAVADAVERVIRGEDTTALCLVRPPGHHARPAAAMGFCLFDNVAVGARLAIEEFGLDRVLIIDWDVHHGNGTQEIFWRDEQVGFLSVHRWPFYPGTGDVDETGEGPALGTKLNLPLEFGTPRTEYIARFTSAVTGLADRVRPQLILISAGFDSHRTDPIGSLGLETEDFAALTAVVREVAAAHCGGRTVSVLEGGYNPPVLAECVALHLEELLKTAH